MRAKEIYVSTSSDLYVVLHPNEKKKIYIYINEVDVDDLSFGHTHRSMTKETLK